MCAEPTPLTSGSGQSRAKQRGGGLSLPDQCRQAWQQDPDGFDGSQPHSGSTSSAASSAPCSRMYLRPERIGWSAPRVASSTPSQSLAPAAREKRRTRPAAKLPLVRFRFAASRETRCARSPPIEATAARATCGLEQVRRISRTITGSPFSRGTAASYGNRICSQHVIAQKIF
jgi:hypothetical protein